jgi:hypothetical protein
MERVDVKSEGEAVPSYGLLVINHAYNEGRITFREWLEQSRMWALRTIEQHKEGATPPSPLLLTQSEPPAEAD